MQRYLRHGISIILAPKQTCSTKFVVHPYHLGRRLTSYSWLGPSSRHPKGHVCEEVRKVRCDLTYRNRAPNSNPLTDARRVICKIEYYPRNVPPQNPSLERSGKKDIELSYNLPPMGRQEHTFGRSLTTLTTVVRIAVSHSIGAPIGPPVYTGSTFHRLC